MFLDGIITGYLSPKRINTRIIVRSMLKNSTFHYAPVAQLDRVPGYELGGREFESLRARQSIKNCIKKV